MISAGLALAIKGIREFHGRALARQLEADNSVRRFAGYGTIYKALDRLEEAELLTSRWEDPEIAAAENRPRRCYYEVTAAGAAALARHETAAVAAAKQAAPRLAAT